MSEHGLSGSFILELEDSTRLSIWIIQSPIVVVQLLPNIYVSHHLYSQKVVRLEISRYIWGVCLIDWHDLFVHTPYLLHIARLINSKISSITAVKQSKNRSLHNPHIMFNVIPINDLLLEVANTVLQPFSRNLIDLLAICHSRVLSKTEVCLHRGTIKVPKNHGPSKTASQQRNPDHLEHAGSMNSSEIRKPFQSRREVKSPHQLSETSNATFLIIRWMEMPCSSHTLTHPWTCSKGNG